MKRLFKILAISIASIIGVLLFYLAVAFCLSRIPVNSDAISSDEISIYIKTNGVHTDIVVPVRTDQIDWSKTIRYVNTVGKDSTATLLALGWGDKGFYMETPTWADLKASTALKAASGFSSSAMHATFYRSLTEDKDCRRIGITKEQYQKLITYIQDSFQKSPDGKPIYIKSDANYNDRDAFYEAVGSYSIFKTCNTWTNGALKACDQKACLWTAFDTGIFKLYE